MQNKLKQLGGGDHVVRQFIDPDTGRFSTRSKSFGESSKCFASSAATQNRTNQIKQARRQSDGSESCHSSRLFFAEGGVANNTVRTKRKEERKKGLDAASPFLNPI